MSVSAIDLDLGEDREANVELAGDEFPDLVFRATFLLTELVAGKSPDLEALCFVLVVDGDELLVVAAGKSTCASHIDGQDSFGPFELA